MPVLKLRSKMDSHFTAVPHSFIDVYMPSANGEFVKVYLYLLRSLRGPDQELSLSLLADRLFCTEKDVMRALGYWEKQGLLSLSRDGSGQPAGIVLLETASGAASGGESAEALPAAPDKPDAPSTGQTAPEPPSVPRFTRDWLEAMKQD